MKKYFLLVFTVALFGCPHHVASANDNNSKDSTVNDAADTSSLKPQAAGFAFRDFELVDTNNTDIDLLKIVNTIVVKVYWQDIQPQENGPLVHPNAIDNALNYVRTMNAKNPGMNLCLKVRLYCGIAAPQWLKNKAGTFTLQSMAGNADCVKFWDPVCITAYADIQKKMAEAYDNIPEIRDIVNSGTGSSTAEGMIRNAGKSGAHKQNAMSYLQAGYTTSKDIDAIKKSIDAMKVWKHTRISMAFSSFALISNNNIGDDVNISLQLLDYFVNTLGKQAVPGNNGLRDDASGTNAEKWAEGGANDKIYDRMQEDFKTKHTGVYFQTAVLARIGDINKAMEQGLARGAGMIELPGGSKSILKFISLDDLKKYDTMLETQAIR